MKKLFLLATMCIAVQSSVNAMSEYPLHDAVKRGDEAQVTTLLATGIDINQQSDIRETPLHKAVNVGHVGIIRLLLDHGASVQKSDSFDATPLHIAAEGDKDPEIIQLLLDHGALLNVQDHAGRTPLHAAVGFGSPTTVKLLLDRGADLDLLEYNGATALEFGEVLLQKDRIRHPENVQLLKDHLIPIYEKRNTLLKSNVYKALKNFTGNKASLGIMIETIAHAFGEERANPYPMAPRWEKAYIAYVFHEITQGNATLDEILTIGQRVESPYYWDGMHLPFKICKWNDEPIRSYFDLGWGQMLKSIKDDWRVIEYVFDSMNDEK
jgi:hypothetical protein